MNDSLKRESLILSADIRIPEYQDAICQLISFLPPSKSSLPVSHILDRVRDFIRTAVLTCNISINLLIFHIQVKCTPGHTIEIYIRRRGAVLPDGIVERGGIDNLDTDRDFELIYSGEWR